MLLTEPQKWLKNYIWKAKLYGISYFNARPKRGTTCYHSFSYLFLSQRKISS